MTTHKPSIGILGAGKLGVVLGQLATKAGYKVAIAGSGDPAKINLTVSVLVPGATVDTKEAVAEHADIVILAVPLGKYKTLPAASLRNKIVIDAMNYWWEVDGDQPALLDPQTSTSEEIQRYLPESRVVKALSHIGYHDLYDETKPVEAEDRKAVAFAGDTPADIPVVTDLISDLGFDPVYIGNLTNGRLLQPGSSVFGAHVRKDDLLMLLNSMQNNLQ